MNLEKLLDILLAVTIGVCLAAILVYGPANI